jgi:hypothetical protein
MKVVACHDRRSVLVLGSIRLCNLNLLGHLFCSDLHLGSSFQVFLY